MKRCQEREDEQVEAPVLPMEPQEEQTVPAYEIGSALISDVRTSEEGFEPSDRLDVVPDLRLRIDDEAIAEFG